MRILWIVNELLEVMLPYAKGKPSSGVSWIAPLLYSLSETGTVKMGCISPVIKGDSQKMEIYGIQYYTIPIVKLDNIKDMSSNLAEKYLLAINDFKPDLIHVHGTEKNFGLLRKFVNAEIPIVCSIQGVVSPCFEGLKFSIASIGIKRYRSIKNILGRGGVGYALRKWHKFIPIEREIFKLNNYFVGRTNWDKAFLKSINADAKYYHGEEMLRNEFYDKRWDIEKCERYRIFISSAVYPLKGLHVLMEAVALLKKDYPDIKIVAPLAEFESMSIQPKDYLFKEDYANYIKSLANKLGIMSNIIFRKRLSASDMADEYCKAHVFTLPSFIENSPNALGESMMIGVPSVVSFVGGVPSIVENDKSTLMFTAGDYMFLAYQLKRIFNDDELAKKISVEAQLIAAKRHDKVFIIKQYMEIYADIIGTNNLIYS